MRFSPGKKRDWATFDMTPMIDVVFQLIIFFMYTSQFAQLARTPIDLPEQPGDREKASGPTTVAIDIDDAGQLLVEGERVTLGELRRIVSAEVASAGGRPELVTVLIRADQDIDARPINRIATSLAGLGVHGWKLGTVDPPGGGGR